MSDLHGSRLSPRTLSAEAGTDHLVALGQLVARAVCFAVLDLAGTAEMPKKCDNLLANF